METLARYTIRWYVSLRLTTAFLFRALMGFRKSTVMAFDALCRPQCKVGSRVLRILGELVLPPRANPPSEAKNNVALSAQAARRSSLAVADQTI